jgi:fermentation-respiration switch protein FrsA (DUF1100 family)
MLHLPPHEPIAAIVGCHGLMANKDSPKQIELARRCNAVGMAYFRFDHRGCGQSSGIFETDTTLENRQVDLIAAVGAVQNFLGEAIPTGLFGSSFGGTVCIAAYQHIAPFAMVTLAAPVHSQSVHMPENSPQSLKNELLRDQLTFNLTSQLSTIRSILVVHGSHDETVEVESAHTIYRLARAPKKRLILDRGDHRISDRSHQRRYLRKTIDWLLDRYQEQISSIH